MAINLNVSISNDSDLNNDIWSVLNDIYFHFNTLIPNGPPLGHKNIFIIHNPSHPVCIVNSLPIYYTIGLTNADRNYSRIVYQFAHELCHIYCDPRVTNWFIESICEMTSLYFLEFLCKKWQTDPPYPNWKDYSIQMCQYKENEIDRKFSNLNIDNRIINYEWLKQEVSSLNTPYNRDINTVIALECLLEFESNKNLWNILPSLGKSTNTILTNTDFSFYENTLPDFDTLKSHVMGTQEELSISKIIQKINFKKQ